MNKMIQDGYAKQKHDSGDPLSSQVIHDSLCKKNVT